MDELNILRVGEAFRIDETGQTRTVMVVMYKVGPHGPFSFEVPAADFDEVKVRAELETRAAKLRALSASK